MEGLDAARKTTTEEICQLKVDLCREVTARSTREEDLVRLREELGKKGSEMLEDSKLQQKESTLLAAQQAFEEMCQRAKGAEVTLRSNNTLLKR